MRRFLLPCKHGKESPNKEEYKASIDTRGHSKQKWDYFLDAVSESIADEGADEAMEFGVWLDEHLPLHQADPGDDTNHIISATCAVQSAPRTRLAEEAIEEAELDALTKEPTILCPEAPLSPPANAVEVDWCNQAVIQTYISAVESAQAEIKLWFGEDLNAWTHHSAAWVYE